MALQLSAEILQDIIALQGNEILRLKGELAAAEVMLLCIVNILVT